MPMWDDRIIVGYDSGIPYGTYRTNWKITLFFMGKFTISMGHGFHSKLLVYQAGYLIHDLGMEENQDDC